MIRILFFDNNKKEAYSGITQRYYHFTGMIYTESSYLL